MATPRWHGQLERVAVFSQQRAMGQHVQMNPTVQSCAEIATGLGRLVAVVCLVMCAGCVWAGCVHVVWDISSVVRLPDQLAPPWHGLHQHVVPNLQPACVTIMSSTDYFSSGTRGVECDGIPSMPPQGMPYAGLSGGCPLHSILPRPQSMT
jgi:hypothetical protein